MIEQRERHHLTCFDFNRYLGKVGVAPCIFLSPRQSARDVEKSVKCGK